MQAFNGKEKIWNGKVKVSADINKTYEEKDWFLWQGGGRNFSSPTDFCWRAIQHNGH